MTDATSGPTASAHACAVLSRTLVDAIGLLGLVGAGLAVLGAVLSGWLIRQRDLRHAGLTPAPDTTDRSDMAGGLVQNGGTRSRRPPEEIV